MRSKLPVAVLALGVIAACSDTVRNPFQPAARRSTTSGAVSNESGHTFDDAMARVAARAPGFGGLYIDKSGQPVAYLQDVSKGSELQAALAAELGNVPRIAGKTLTVRHGDFDVRQLLSWRVALEGTIDMSAISFTQIAHSINRVHVGVKTPADVAAIQAAVARLGIPAAAVKVSVLPLTTRVATTLNDRIRPVTGGIEIGTAPPAGFPSHSCTLGLPVRLFGGLNPPNYFLTNAHCGDSLGYADYIGAWQFVVLSADSIGHEVIDPAWQPNIPGCASPWNCRYSDAAIYSSSLPRADVAFGTVAQTASYPPSGTWGVDGSKTIAGPNFSIVSDAPDLWLVPGQLYQKVGKATGWTSGYIFSMANGDPIDGSCVFTTYPVSPDIKGSGGNKALICQYYGSTWAVPGDSGSPIFIPATSSSVYFLGVLWGVGSVSGVGYSIWSSSDNIKKDLGSILTH